MNDGGNLFDSVPDSLLQEEVTPLLSTPGIVIERIVSTGQSSPADFWYDQDFTEWVVVLSGAAALLFEGEGEPRKMHAGSYLVIPPHRRHRVAWTDPEHPTVWLAVRIADGLDAASKAQ
jgi:cupin 2 domain-containing protein